MTRFVSPLRYPGGKRKLAKFMQDLININGLNGGIYVEPFAGGASVALHLLFTDSVKKIIVNDLDRSIYAFWYCVINSTSEFCARIRDVEVTIAEWEKQKSVQQNKVHVDLFDLGFSTFFLNRTNRSGIVNGGVIGGKKQAGNWKLDARFNKPDLIKRIERIALYGDKISLHCADSMVFMDNISSQMDDHTLIYLDPPYYEQGSALYVNHYEHQDHYDLSEYIKQLNCSWILTYDHTPQIMKMYSDVEKKSLTLSYTASRKTRGIEMLAYSDNLKIPTGEYSSILID